jgi:hypothetical protein
MTGPRTKGSPSPRICVQASCGKRLIILSRTPRLNDEIWNAVSPLSQGHRFPRSFREAGEEDISTSSYTLRTKYLRFRSQAREIAGIFRRKPDLFLEQPQSVTS